MRYWKELIFSSYVFRMTSLASRLAFNFASLVSMTVVGITGLIESLDDLAPVHLGLVGLRNPSIVVSGLGVLSSINSPTTLVLSSSLIDGSPFVGSTADVMLVSVR